MTGEYRLRVCYSKSGRLRWLSHLEVLRAFERLVRRAGLQVSMTQGFSPHMKIAFGPALPVGTAGMREYADVWLTRYTEPSEVLKCLQASSPSDLKPSSATYVSAGLPSLSAALTIGMYRMEVEGPGIDATAVHEGLKRLMALGTLTVEQKGKTKVYDLALCVPKDARVESQESRVAIEIPIRMGQHGSLRPEILLRNALANHRPETLSVHTTRLDLLMEDEEGVWLRPV